MTSVSLTNMTVPLSSDGSATNQGLLMPKLKYRFRVAMQNFGIATDTTVLTTQVIDCTRPSLNFNPFEVPVYNSRIYLSGKPEWEPVTLTLRDDAQGQVAILVGQQIQMQFDFLEQSSAASGVDYKFTMTIQILDGGNGSYTPVVLEEWDLLGAQIASVNYGDLNYSTSEPATIQMTIRYDNALNNPVTQGVGAAVGRTEGTVATG
jgi:hypothetical protein